jgi:thiol-disulfide isomerase/thioredoxin
MPAGGPRLILYSRNYCHLCHDMLAALEALRGEPGVADFEVEVLDVDADPALEAKYDELVPVLAAADGRELCHYFLDAPKVREYLNSFG